jgi:hypothetical protein
MVSCDKTLKLMDHLGVEFRYYWFRWRSIGVIYMDLCFAHYLLKDIPSVNVIG